MSDQAVKSYQEFVLPASLVTKADISRLVNEVERIDNELTTSMVRKEVGAAEQASPTFSEQLADFLTQNKLSLDDERLRGELIKELRLLKEKAPIIHMTFAVTADGESLRQLAQWLRTSTHPQALIDVGLQPALVAGVYLRTPNQVHDLSLRALLKNGQGKLVEELETLRGRQ